MVNTDMAKNKRLGVSASAVYVSKTFLTPVKNAMSQSTMTPRRIHSRICSLHSLRSREENGSNIELDEKKDFISLLDYTVQEHECNLTVAYYFPFQTAQAIDFPSKQRQVGGGKEAMISSKSSLPRSCKSNSYTQSAL
jgi:hypothetical protein